MFISVNSIAFAIAPSAVGTVFLIVKYSFLRISILFISATSSGIFPAIIFLSFSKLISSFLLQNGAYRVLPSVEYGIGPIIIFLFCLSVSKLLSNIVSLANSLHLACVFLSISFDLACVSLSISFDSACVFLSSNSVNNSFSFVIFFMLLFAKNSSFILSNPNILTFSPSFDNFSARNKFLLSPPIIKKL